MRLPRVFASINLASRRSRARGAYDRQPDHHSWTRRLVGAVESLNLEEVRGWLVTFATTSLTALLFLDSLTALT